MRLQTSTLIAFGFFTLFLIEDTFSFSDPWENGEFKGRIAYSADGNFNDEDDWAASPVALAIFKEFGVFPRTAANLPLSTAAATAAARKESFTAGWGWGWKNK